jgi:hypothetical protein
MTRSELQVLSEAFAVAMVAMVARETRTVPMTAAFALREAAARDFPDFVPVCTRFAEQLRASHGLLDPVAAAGQALRDEVARAMTFVPRDADRVDIHG